MARSRRGIFEAHADPTRMARCPVCRRAIEEDHDEALGMQAGGALPPAPLAGPAPTLPEEQEQEAELVVGFALV